MVFKARGRIDLEVMACIGQSMDCKARKNRANRKWTAKHTGAILWLRGVDMVAVTGSHLVIKVTAL